MRIVIALVGNALLRRGGPRTTEVQRRNVAVVHGNGPQVGLRVGH